MGAGLPEEAYIVSLKARAATGGAGQYRRDVAAAYDWEDKDAVLAPGRSIVDAPCGTLGLPLRAQLILSGYCCFGGGVACHH
jgi:hypothetical protein